MTPEQETSIDWSLCTWKGSRRRQHEEFYALPFRRKLEIAEELSAFTQATLESRRRKGLPYFDPATGELVTAGNSQKTDEH